MKIFSNKQINRIASTSYGINYQVIASICSMEDIYSEHATLEEAIDSAERAQQSFMNVKIKDVATGECWLDIEDAKYDLYNGFVESATTFKTDKRLSPIAAAINDERTDYEIEHGITYTRSYSNKYGDQISIFVYDDDPDKQEYGEGGPSGDYFRGRWTQNMQDYYTRKGFKLDSTSDLDASSNVKASNDGYNPYSFMVGDQLEWSGLHGGQYKGIVTNVNDEYVTVDVMWTSEDSGDTIIDTQQFEIATDPDGKECIIVWTYGSDAGYVYPPSSSSANSSTDIQSSYDAYGDILSFICPICQNDTVYSTEKDIYHPCEVDYEELFICDECGAELKAYPKYDGTVDFIPLMDDEY